jgi:hypothetical protein
MGAKPQYKTGSPDAYVQMGTQSANAIRASRLDRLHNRPDIRLQPCLLLRHMINVTCDPGGAHIRPSLGFN